MAATANKRFRPRTDLLAACAGLALAPSAYALDWQIQPSVGASATYTDNANQSATNPEDALILSVTPGVSLASKGSRRVQASLNYGLSGVARFGHDDSTDLNHRLGAVGKAELVEDFLFIDGSANISQELISLTGSPAGADVNDSNRATVGTYSISPYIQQRLGTFANAQARVTQSGAIFENDVASNSNVSSFTAGLTSGTRFTDLSWGLNYSIRKADNRNASDSTFERASATVGYALTRKFRVFGTYGQDWNEYEGNAGATSEFDGSFYSVGFDWAPNRRTNLEMSAGERYFGKTFSASGSYRTRSTRWTLRYMEDVSDITQQFLEQGSRTFWVCNVGGVNRAFSTDAFPLPPAGICLSSPVTAFGLAALGVPVSDLVAAGLINIGTSNGVYVLKSLNAGVVWDAGRLSFGFSAQDARRLYELFNAGEDRIQSVTGSVSYRMTPQTTATGSLSLTRTQVDNPGAAISRDDDLMTFTLGLSHAFAEKLNGALTFRHTERDSNVATADYSENNITATVNMRF
ncbi:MAG: TIGR03016 family PEP-CTERM system-associated outer membrane protein [Pseudomonadota bacterium]